MNIEDLERDISECDASTEEGKSLCAIRDAFYEDDFVLCRDLMDKHRENFGYKVNII